MGPRQTDEHRVYKLYRRGTALENHRDRLHRLNNAPELEYDEPRVSGPRHERQSEFGNDTEGALRSREQLCRIKWGFEKIVETVSGSPPPVLREITLYRFRIFFTQSGQLIKQTPRGPALFRPRKESVFTEGAEFDRITAQENLRGLDVVPRHAVEDRMRPRGVIADDPSRCRDPHRGRVGSEHQPRGFKPSVELLYIYSRLYTGGFGFGIYFNDIVQVLREIYDKGMAHRLPCKARAPAPRQYRGAEPTGGFDGDRDVLLHPGYDDAYGLYLVIARIRAVERPAQFIEADFALYGLLERGFELFS